ncbi:hypothetical protein MMC09_002904 [Bachmanniomyces sp. S44760]|nr:hypothetical protein [Bachmanniomyces sp. S44760]
MVGSKPKPTTNRIQDLLTAEETPTTFALSHPKHVPFIASPLISPETQHLNHHGEPTKMASAAISSTDGFESPELSHNEKDDDPEEPKLKRAHESSVIQLFYDLFFVANLTTFTSAHEINSGQTLSSYLGFFTVLWFTWLQVALFDVRFSQDSAFERFCKALQFGVMTGLAIVGPHYNLEDESNLKSLKTLSFILMASRLILALQYAVVFWWTKNYKKAHAPILIHVGLLFATAMVYLGLAFSFVKGSLIGMNGHIGWYITMFFEALIVIFVSGTTKFASFRQTNIIERLGLLTLIILGEGVIGLSGSILKVQTAGTFSPDMIGMIICGVVILYFLFILYFDQIETERVGTRRQQLWTILHFPFHICVLLVVEGVSQFAIWRELLDIILPYQTTSFEIFFANVTDTAILSLDVDALNETSQAVIERFSELSTYVKPDIQDDLLALADPNVLANLTKAELDFSDIYSQVTEWVAQTYGVKIPEEVAKAGDASAAVDAIISTYITVFVYLFIAGGGVLMLLSILFWIGKRRHSRAEYLSIGMRFVVGMAVTLISIMYAPKYRDGDTFTNYFTSAWVLPTLLFAYGFVILVDILLVGYVKSAVHKRHDYRRTIPA